MNAKNFFKRMIPAAFAGAAALVLAMPMNAMAHDWDHHDNGRHMGWFHRDHDSDDCGLRGRGFYPRSYYPAPQAYQMPYGYGGYGYGNGMNRLQQKLARTEALHQRALANGNRRMAKITSEHMYELEREGRMNGRYGTPYYGYGQDYGYGQGYGQTGSVLGNMFGLW